MKKLNELFDCPYETEIKDIKINSKEIEAGDLFVCTYGVTADRHDFIDSAIESGAAAIVVMKDVGEKSVPIIKVDNTNEALHDIARKFYDDPLSKLRILAVTGTDGKTSTAIITKYLIGDKCAYIGSNGRICHAFTKETNNTTPDADKMYKYLDEFVKVGCDTVVLETSSEAFFRNRLPGFIFESAAYTNITTDHINIHKTWDNYFACKMDMFKQVSPNGYSILNKDDEHYETVLKHVKNPLTYGKKGADLSFDFELGIEDTIINFDYQGKKFRVRSPLIGDFNVYNLAAALLMALSVGEDLNKLIDNIDNIVIDGRIEKLPSAKGFTVIVDYAHTTFAIQTVVKMFKQIVKGRLIVVTGAAGARESSKRPVIAKFLVENSDHFIITTDDPFTEDPLNIINDLESGAKGYDNYEIIVDRKEAIKKAVQMGEKDDIILILGRGAENYQTVGYERIYLNDKEEVLKYI